MERSAQEAPTEASRIMYLNTVENCHRAYLHLQLLPYL